MGDFNKTTLLSLSPVAFCVHSYSSIRIDTLMSGE